ncbi:chromosome partition protein Smc [Variibacter gotjawalensis]|uniref:Chromosome partition protein Smc n=2 Tax=Variibacter gotjawalensis TaxID=1333996 RepID=A0A0S3PTP3_9BRAD|nr:hypothetical protein EV661_3830 [Variibacter gotjawalensis]BAT59184.1 chromosome partition protein Smc [Variibacter gotjawalensis]
MYIGLGFLVASLLALIVLPLVHARAVRLTRRRVEAAIPQSIGEVQAEKDQLRAEFAVSSHRLEANMENLRAKTTQQLAEVGKKTIQINQIKQELEQTAAQLTGAETREQELRTKLADAERGIAERATLIAAMEQKLGEHETQMGKLGREFAERSMAADSQQIEIVALRTQIATLQGQVSEAQNRAAAREQEQGREKAQQAATTQALADLKRERDQLRGEADGSRRIQEDLRQELAAIDQRHRAANEHLRAEKAMLEGQLQRARADRAGALQELASQPRNGAAAAPQVPERAENDAIRNSINDVAAEVVRLTAMMEGQQGPLGDLLAQDAKNRGGLAERIRMLQARGSRQTGDGLS